MGTGEVTVREKMNKRGGKNEGSINSNLNPLLSADIGNGLSHGYGGRVDTAT